MKTIGLIGGMSWESTATYYQLINQGIKESLGGLHSAKLILVSFDFAEVEALQSIGDWQSAAQLLIRASHALEAAGADAVMICTNTMHKVSQEIETHISIPLLHIADATAAALIQDSVHKVGLLGTAFTMEQTFYSSRIQAHGIDVVTPNDDDRVLVHKVIYQELCLGRVIDASKQAYINVINSLADCGAEAIVLACTEIGLLVQQADTRVALYDTTEIHAQAAVKFMLS